MSNATIEVRRAQMSAAGDYRPAYKARFNVAAIPPVGGTVQMAHGSPDKPEWHTVRAVIYTLDQADLDAIVVVELDTVWDGEKFVYPPDRNRGRAHQGAPS
jgi:hypothetical protein